MKTTSQPVTEAEIAEGHAIYTSFNLNFYNLVVLGLSNAIFWKCPTKRILAFYDEHVSDNHLDIGVGTGYYLDRCKFPGTTPRLGIMDINEPSLERTAQLISRYSPEVYVADLYKKDQVAAVKAPFDSIALCYLFHCMPGNLEVKTQTFEHLRAILNPGGKIFGATILGKGGAKKSALTRWRMNQLNAAGVLHNLEDDRDALEQGLARHFTDCKIEVVEHVALFSARYEG